MRNAVLISTSFENSITERTAESLNCSGFKTSILKIDQTCADTGNIKLEKDRTDYFIENRHDTPTYNIKKHFFCMNAPFFSFGTIKDDGRIICCKGSLDIGADWNVLKKEYPVQNNSEDIYPSEFNGLLAIETPPDSIPLKYFYHFKHPSNIAGTYISIMDRLKKRHDAVRIIPSAGSMKFDQFFKERASDCNDVSELEPGTTVLTWSTERFFKLLKTGLRPVPVSKCLALWTYGSKKRNLAEMIIKGPEAERINAISGFISSSSISRFESKTS